MTTLLTFPLEIVRHTPVTVWCVLAGLIALGMRQMKDSTMSRRRLLIAPVALGAYSLYGASSLFGAHVDVFAAWAVALLLVVAAQTMRRTPGTARFDTGDQVLVRGSAWPLVTMLAVFALRYVANVSLAIHPELAHDAVFGLTMAAGYGALSGVFVARAVRLLRGGSNAPVVAATPSAAS